MTTLDPELAAILRNLDSRVGNVEGQLGGMNGRLSNVEEQLGGMNGRLGNVEGQLGGMNGRLSRVDVKVEEHSKLLQDLRNGQRQIIITQWATGITIAAGLFGTLVTLIFRLSGG